MASTKLIQMPIDRKNLQIFIPNNTNDQFINSEITVRMNESFLDDQENWLVAVNRVRIPLITVPLFIFDDKGYWLSFSLGQNNAHMLDPVKVTYDIPCNNAQGYPQNRFVFYYEQFLTMVNTQLKELWKKVIVDLNYQAIIPASLQEEFTAPYFKRNEGSPDLFDLVLPYDHDVTPSCPFYYGNPDGINILMSPALFYFFAGFNAQLFQSGINGNTNLKYRLQIDTHLHERGVDEQWDGHDIFNILIVRQNYSTIHLWQMINKIFITSDLLNVVKDRIYVKGNERTTSNVEILADFEIPPASSEWRDDVFYTPEGNLKWNNFIGTGALKEVDIKIYYQTKDMQVFPLVLPPNYHCDVMLKFKRRRVIESYEQEKPK